MFFVLAGLMLALALVFILWPFFRSAPSEAPSTQQAILDALRVQRADVEREFAAGRLGAEQREEALNELARRLADELGPEIKVEQLSGFSAQKPSKPAWVLGFGVALFVVGLSSGGYAMWGSFGVPSAKPTAAAAGASAQPDAASQAMSEDVLKLIDNLARKMEENPGDPKGWILLARSQAALGNWPAAVRAYERALTLLPKDPNVMADLADALAAQADGVLTGRPTELVERALKIDPKHLKSLALAGTAAMRRGEMAASIAYWKRMQAILPADSDDALQVAAIIKEIESGRGGAPVMAQANTAPPTPAAPQASAQPPVAASAPSGARGPTRAATVGVSGTIRVAPQLLARAMPGDTLFVLARAAAAPGGGAAPRMPLAVFRVPLPSRWPYEFTLTDDMAMAPGMNLSAFPNALVEARISRSGMATPQSGDITGTPMPAQSGKAASPEGSITLVLDRVVP